MRVLTLPDVTDKIKEALRAGFSGETSFQNPYKRLGLPANPFHRKQAESDEHSFIVREDVLVNLAMHLGNAIRLFESDFSSPFRHLLTHGLRGCGKTTQALHFTEQWSDFGFRNYEILYENLSTWIDPNELRESFSSSSKSLKTYKRFLNNIAHVTKPLIILFDDFDYALTGTSAIPRFRNMFADIEARAPNGVIIIGIVNSLTLTTIQNPQSDHISRSLFSQFNPDHYFFPVFSKTEIRQLLNSRLRDARRPTQLFTIKALELIADFSMGIPTSALKMGSACLNELIVGDLEKVDSNIALKVIEQSGFSQAAKLVESMDGTDEDDPIHLLTRKRLDVIDLILNHQIRERYFFPPTGIDGLRISDLAQEFGVNLSTMNYHVKPLTQTEPIPILQSKEGITDARSKILRISWKTPIADALEIITVSRKLTSTRYHVTDQAIIQSMGEKKDDY